MVLGELHELIETLQQQITEQGAEFQRSEAATRVALIDPLLRALDWDTSDPRQVSVERRLSDRSIADYLLMGAGGSPSVVIEAKKLNGRLTDATQQASKHCAKDRIPYFAVTDGRRWKLYKAKQHGETADREIITFDLTESAPIVCVKALSLWREYVVRQYVASNSIPTASEPPRKQAPTAQTAATKDEPHGWQSLTSNLHMWKGRLRGFVCLTAARRRFMTTKTC